MLIQNTRNTTQLLFKETNLCSLAIHIAYFQLLCLKLNLYNIFMFTNFSKFCTDDSTRNSFMVSNKLIFFNMHCAVW